MKRTLVTYQCSNDATLAEKDDLSKNEFLSRPTTRQFYAFPYLEYDSRTSERQQQQQQQHLCFHA
jgi:hypothetical protein